MRAPCTLERSVARQGKGTRGALGELTGSSGRSCSSSMAGRGGAGTVVGGLLASLGARAEAVGTLRGTRRADKHTHARRGAPALSTLPLVGPAQEVGHARLICRTRAGGR